MESMRIHYIVTDRELVRVVLPEGYMADKLALVAFLRAGAIRRAKRSDLKALFSEGFDDFSHPLRTFIAYEVGSTIVIRREFDEDDFEFSWAQFKETFQPEIAPFIVPLDYRIRIDRVAPVSAKQTWKNQGRCILGFSPGNASLVGKRLEAFVSWIDKNFKECAICYPDSMHGYTLQIREGISHVAAVLQAKKVIHDIVERNRELFENFTKCNFQTIFFSEIQLTKEYSSYYESLKCLAATNEKFRNSVNKFASDFVDRRNVDRGVVYGEHLVLARNYLIEELACLARLYGDDWHVLLYPGTIGVLEEIAAGEHPGVPENLARGVHVSLTTRSRGIV